MSYLVDANHMTGFEDRCNKVSRVLKALSATGFTNPIAYGKGLSQFLNGIDETKTRIKIECDFPARLVPGRLDIWGECMISGRADPQSIMIGKTHKAFNNIANIPQALKNLGYGTDYLNDRDENKLHLSTAGFGQQRLDITAFHSPFARMGQTELLERQHGTLNKIAMRLDEQKTTIITRHPQWQDDSANSVFRITEDLGITDAHLALAAYFHERAKGEKLSLEIDNTSPQNGDTNLQARAEHLDHLHDAALRIRKARAVNDDINGCKDDQYLEVNTYYEAARFLDQLDYY